MQCLIRGAHVALTTLLFSPVLIVGSANAAAPEAATGDSVFASVGTGGLDLGYAKRFNSTWGGRIMLNSGIRGDADNVEVHDNHYDLKLKNGAGVGVLADFYPIADSGFHVSGGIYVAKHKTELDGRSGSSYSLNGRTYTAAQLGRLSGERDYGSVAPYFGVGWESKPTNSGWRFVSDLGFKFLKSSSTKLDASGASSNAALRNDVEAERRHLDKNGIEVMASIGASYSF